MADLIEPLTREDHDILSHGARTSVTTARQHLDLTVTDFTIWLSLVARSEYLGHPLARISPSDRHDASLMYWLQALARYHNQRFRIPLEQAQPIAHRLMQIDCDWPIGHLGVSSYMAEQT